MYIPHRMIGILYLLICFCIVSVKKSNYMESKGSFEKIMQDYNQNGDGRCLRKYCKDEAVENE
ncbi:hypothetical protein JCM17136A_16440 [Phocaeicola sartorii JCM 17136 = DSM 21941]